MNAHTGVIFHLAVGKMNAETFGSRLRLWRRTNMVKQAALAHDLGVTQAAVSRWENGLDTPSARLMGKLEDLLTNRDSLPLIERHFIERQAAVRGLFDIDGVRLLTSSHGLRQLWPDFAAMQDIALADYVVGELAALIHDAEYSRQIRKGEMLLVTGVTERHLDLDIDHAVRHRWHVCMRPIGTKILGDMVFEPCAAATPAGIESVLNAHDLTG